MFLRGVDVTTPLPRRLPFLGALVFLSVSPFLATCGEEGSQLHELEGVRVLKAESVDLMFQNHLKPELGQKYGLGGAVDSDGGYAWGGANGTQFWLDRTNQLFGIFMVQTQNYRAPTYNAFKTLVNESAGIASKGGLGAQGQGGGASGMNSLFKQRDKNSDGKLGKDELPAALFDRLDADKDGFVTEEELKALRRPN